MKNALYIIRPYKWYDMWVFDDPRLDLQQEPFVESMASIINSVLKQKGMELVEAFTMLFSDKPFPDADIKLEWEKEEDGGNWYTWGERKGWLCPALLKYYYEPPQAIYIQVQGKK